MQKSTTVTAAPVGNTPAMSKAAQSAWKVTFSSAKPAAMPTDRMKARGETVRAALTSATY